MSGKAFLMGEKGVGYILKILGGPKVGIQCVVRIMQLRNLFRWLIVHLSHMYFGSYKNHSHSLMFNIPDT